MKTKQLNINSEFTVKEEKILNYIIAALFFALFSYGLSGIIIHKLKADYSSFLFLLALLPALLFFKKGRSANIYIRINKNGIYQNERLVTDWTHFLNAYIDQKEKIIKLQDNFQLVVEYVKETGQGLRRKIPLTNTQNKSEEEVLAAVKFFSKHAKK